MTSTKNWSPLMTRLPLKNSWISMPCSSLSCLGTRHAVQAPRSGGPCQTGSQLTLRPSKVRPALGAAAGPSAVDANGYSSQLRPGGRGVGGTVRTVGHDRERFASIDDCHVIRVSDVLSGRLDGLGRGDVP